MQPYLLGQLPPGDFVGPIDQRPIQGGGAIERQPEFPERLAGRLRAVLHGERVHEQARDASVVQPVALDRNQVLQEWHAAQEPDASSGRRNRDDHGIAAGVVGQTETRVAGVDSEEFVEFYAHARLRYRDGVGAPRFASVTKAALGFPKQVGDKRRAHGIIGSPVVLPF
ncbi:hypothetical protein D3C71_1260040 [compost metagenome]